MQKLLNVSFSKVLNVPHTQLPRVINVAKDKAYPPAIKALKTNEVLPQTTTTRQCKYLNNIVEQDHRFIKQRIRPSLRFSSFNTAWHPLRGYEVMHMIHKGQIKRNYFLHNFLQHNPILPGIMAAVT